MDFLKQVFNQAMASLSFTVGLGAIVIATNSFLRYSWNPVSHSIASPLLEFVLMYLLYFLGFWNLIQGIKYFQKKRR